MLKDTPTSYTLLGMILVMSSCSHEYIGSSDSNDSEGRIEFRASLPELDTRATELKVSTLNSFQASAFTVGESSESLYFANKTFSINDKTDKFVCYDPQCIWPNNNDLLRFVTFAPTCEAMLAAGGRAASTGEKLNGFRVAQDIASQFDFVTAIATGRLLDNEETGITLLFQHQLSRIELKAWGNSTSYDLEIAGVRIGGIGTGGVFDFTAQANTTGPAQAGVWESVTKGYVEYVFQNGDAIVTLDKSDGSPLSADKAVSILGSKIGGENGYENSAMIVPSDNPAWLYQENAANGADHADGMYLSVLVRVRDTTPYDTNGSIVYPYAGDAYSGQTVYLALSKADGKTVEARLYRQGDDYFTDTAHTEPYDLSGNNAEVKAFGWASLPVGHDLEPGRIYTFTLNYSNGVGLRDPRDSNPGEPIISERVLVNVEVMGWLDGAKSDVTVPRR